MCGCDGRTYPNGCAARARGVSIAGAGPCDVEPTPDASSDASDPTDAMDTGDPADATETDTQVPAETGPEGDGGTPGEDASAADAQPDAEPDAGPPRACQDGSQCLAGEFCDNAEGFTGYGCPYSGWCRRIPTACSSEYAPACGCDGQTYRNACIANAASIPTNAGPCPNSPHVTCDPGSQTSCEQGEECVPGYCADQFCVAQCAGAHCQPVPSACPDTREIVCACDGKTYLNECHAFRQRVSVVMRRSCTTCWPNQPSACGPGEFCNFEATQCGPVPSVCPDGCPPVCGCDLRTYPSECHAQQAGTTARSQGACELGGVRLCNAGDCKPCGPDEFCQVGDVLVSNSCGSYDGVCAPRPTSCPPPGPMRACLITGATTSSVCEANRDGLSTTPLLSHCTFPFGRCGFINTWGYVECAADEYCGFADPYCGDDVSSDLICKKIPDSCEGSEGGPVCTCGGLYASACEAARAQQNVAWMSPYVDENGVLKCDPYTYPWPRN